MRVMRRNYDKPHRCPGWSGPALKAGRSWGIDPERCGYLGPRGDLNRKGFTSNGPDPWNSYGLVHCPGCKTWVMPVWARWVDPTYLVFKIRRCIKDWIKDWRMDRE